MSIFQVKEETRVWLRFEGPGKLHIRRWHIAKPFPARGWATLCGLVVRDAEIAETPGEGPQCGTCVQLAERHRGTFL